MTTVFGGKAKKETCSSFFFGFSLFEGVALQWWYHRFVVGTLDRFILIEESDPLLVLTWTSGRGNARGMWEYGSTVQPLAGAVRFR
jgi:hypothetical protein